MNGKPVSGTLGYFDRRTNEEDVPVVPSASVQEKYEHLDAIFEEFFEDNSLTIAKVNYIKILIPKI
jgi:hypothetical protein